jgi:cyclo(L-tyrosyl-L-tyrosyl) synthase
MKINYQQYGKAYTTGYQIIQEKGVAIVGMSPGNSFFDAQTIDDLLAFTSTCFSQVHIMIPDSPAVHTYKAQGYSEDKAQKKARLNGNTLQNHCTRSIERMQDNMKNALPALIEWKDVIETSPAYQSQYTTFLQMYTQNSQFREDVRETTRGVLNSKCESETIEKAIDEGIHYLLKELAFITTAPTILKVDKIAYVYHKQWPVFEKLIAGTYDDRIREDIGFVLVED